MNDSNFEMRAITIRNFSIPPSPSISDIYDLFPNDFISYQNHQVVQISAPVTDLSEVYTKIIRGERGRKENKALNAPHITQTISLVGRSGDFWEQPSPYLFVTFLQTIDYDADGYGQKNDRYNELVSTIEKKLSKLQEGATFALYYAYDFCDYILFVKNATAKTHNSLVWQLTMGTNRKLHCIRDTFSFYVISISHLKHAAEKDVVFSDTGRPIMALAARMSVYSAHALLELKKQLRKGKIKYTICNVFGRYDVEIRTQELTFDQICKFIIHLETAFANNRLENAYAPFGGYEFLPFSTGHSFRNGRIPTRDPAFVQTLEERFINTLEECVDSRFTDYIDEAKRSMRELLLSGFSTEFILGCLSPFSYAIKNLCEKRDVTGAKDDRLVEDARRIFNALNTLTLCMMHGERRFIQAPAFGATYFDIPSKLFAYYAAVIQRIKSCYQSFDCSVEEHGANPWETEDYQFLMVPDFREGINVIPINRKQFADKQKHLCIIYLSEAFFYYPLKAIYLIAQEMAHYISVRNRKKRLEQIIYTVSCIMMCALRNRNKSLTKEELDALYERRSLTGQLAQVVAEYLLASYNAVCGTKHDPLLFSNLKTFLEKMDYGFSLFYDTKIADEISEAWADVINREENEEESLRSVRWVQQKRLGEGVAFLSGIHSCFQGTNYIARIIANEIANTAKEFNLLIPKDNWHAYQETCKSIASVFRESFADYRMAQVLGDGFEPKVYNSLLSLLVQPSFDLDLEIRHDAVLRTLGKLDLAWHNHDKESGIRGNMQYIAIRGVEDYLRSCAIDNTASQHDLSEVAHVFSAATPVQDRCKYILKELNGYMEYLVKHQENDNMKTQPSCDELSHLTLPE